MPHEYRLGTVATDGLDRPALFVGDAVYDLRTLATGQFGGALPATNPDDGALTTLLMLQDWPLWEPALQQLADAIGQGDIAADPLPTPSSLRPPVTRPGTILGIGANYSDHLEEMGVSDPPARPYLFLKPAATSQIGSGQQLTAEPHLQWVDWEAELAVIIGRRARNVTLAEAPATIAGYAVANDVSARDALAHFMPKLGIDWLDSKGLDGFTPIGPAMTPAGFVSDPQNLAIELRVNGVVKQRSSTSRMVTGVYEMIVHASSVFTLCPGDVLLTGTPAGVGFAREPRETLAPGDFITVEIEGLGTLETPVV